VCRGSKDKRLGLAETGSAAYQHCDETDTQNRLKATLIQSLKWPIMNYRVEEWSLNKEMTGNIQAFEMQC